MKERRHKKPWMDTWKESMAFVYMAVIIFDFLLAPIVWPILLSYNHVAITPWSPITLQGAGLFHVAMGAILGVSAWAKGQAERYSYSSMGYDSMPNNPIPLNNTRTYQQTVSTETIADQRPYVDPELRG